MEFLGLYGNAKEVIDILKSIKDRYCAFQENPLAAAALEGTYRRLAERLQSMSENHRETIARFSNYDAAYFEERFKKLSSTFSVTTIRLRTELAVLENPLYRTTRASHTKDLLFALQQDANHAKQKLDEIQNTLAIVSAIPRGELTNCFRSCNTAPPNEAVIVLDFESLDDDGIPLTCEGRLKAAILASSNGESVGAVASGMGGVGKTCTLRALARDPEIRKRFPGGVLFMSLGKDATVADLIERLCSAVEATGGKQLADELRRETVLTTVIEKTRNWFCDHVCLFMIDDVWCSNNIKPDILGQLLIIASNNGQEGGSCFVYSTRDEKLTVLGETIAFKPKESQGTSAVKILLTYAGADENELHDPICEKAIENILNMCAGLPVALSVTGRGVRWKREKCQGDKRQGWVAYWSTIKKDGILDEAAGVYGNVRRSLMVSLDHLDQQRDTSASGMTPFSYREMHRSLCVLQKQDWVPAGELRYPWGLTGEDATVRVIETMGRTGVADEELRMHKGRLCVGLRLHDVVHDFACQEAEEHGEVTMWHKRLLEGMSAGGNASRREACWPVSLGEGDYVFRNICRLLQKSGRAEEIWSLLLSPQWIVKMVKTSAILRLEEDIAICTRGREDENRASTLNMVGRAARLSVSDCVQDSDCIWFQLYARMFVTVHRCETTRRFLARIEATAPKPWLKPTRPCIRGASDALLGSFVVSGRVMDVQFLDEEDVVAYGYEGQEGESNADVWIVKHRSDGERSGVRLQWNSDSDIATRNRIMDVEKREPRVSSGRSVENVTMPASRFCGAWRQVMCCWKGSSGESSESSVQSNYSEESQSLHSSESSWRRRVTCLAIGKDGRRVVTGNGNGLVRTWNIATGMRQGEPDNVHSKEVFCVAMSGNSRRAVSWSFDGTLRIWNVETGKQEGEELECYGIKSLSITGDGMLIASGGCGMNKCAWNIRVWNADTRKCLCAVDVGDPIFDVAISDEGKRVVCGLKNSTVLLVDVEKGAIREEYKGHTDRVDSVDISADGTCLVSGSGDKTVRVWDVERGQQVREFTGHTSWVEKVSISADKRRLMSASFDKTVCLWNLETSKQTDILQTGHDRSVEWISICTDGRFVASCGHMENRIRLWRVVSNDRGISVPHMQHVSIVFVSACEKRTLLGTSFGRVRMWNNGQDVRSFRATEKTRHWHRELLKGAADFGVSKYRGNVVLLGQDNTVRLFHREDHEPSLLSLPKAVISSVAISHCGKLMAFGSKDGKIHFWNSIEEVERGEPLVGHTNEVSCLAFSCSTTFLASGSKDKTVCVWDVSSRKQSGEALVGHTDWVCSVAMSFDKPYIVSGSRDKTVRVWNVNSEDRGYVVFRGHTGSVHSVAISEDGSRVVSGSEDKTVRVWDVGKGKQIAAPLYIYSSTILDVWISNDGMCVMCGSKDGAVRWWDAETGNLMGAEVGGHMGEVYKISESKDGKRMVVASRPTDKYRKWNPEGVLNSPQVRVWDLEKIQCIYVGREDEWNDMSLDYLGLKVRGDGLDEKARDRDKVSTDERRDEVGQDDKTLFRAVGRCIVVGEGSGRILANFEADITSLDVDHQNKVVAAGLRNGIVAILRIVE